MGSHGRKEREEFYIRKFSTFNEGMNRGVEGWRGGCLILLLTVLYKYTHLMAEIIKKLLEQSQEQGESGGTEVDDVGS